MQVHECLPGLALKAVCQFSGLKYSIFINKIGLVFVVRFVNSKEEQIHLCVILLYNSELKLFHVSEIPTCSLIRKLLVEPKIFPYGLKDGK